MSANTENSQTTQYSKWMLLICRHSELLPLWKYNLFHLECKCFFNMTEQKHHKVDGFDALRFHSFAKTNAKHSEKKEIEHKSFKQKQKMTINRGKQVTFVVGVDIINRFLTSEPPLKIQSLLTFCLFTCFLRQRVLELSCGCVFVVSWIGFISAYLLIWPVLGDLKVLSCMALCVQYTIM